MTAEEYPTYFGHLRGLRGLVVQDLLPRLSDPRLILDVPTGYGFFALDLARRLPRAQVVGVDISAGDVARARENAAQAGLTAQSGFLEMDATGMSFGDGTFDLAASFLGLEDIHMTRGRSGVERAVAEIARVLRPGGVWCLAAMPPDKMETPAQRTEVALFSDLCGATWLDSAEYELIWLQAGFKLAAELSYRTGKKLTVGQAREEIRFACDNVPRLYGLPVHSLQEIWEQYGPSIEREGLGHYSKIICFHLVRVR